MGFLLSTFSNARRNFLAGFGVGGFLGGEKRSFSGENLRSSRTEGYSLLKKVNVHLRKGLFLMKGRIEERVRGTFHSPGRKRSPGWHPEKEGKE